MRCVYPTCKTSVEEEGGRCADHAGLTCRYPLSEPYCEGTPLAHSTYCLEHDKLTAFIIRLHISHHQEMAMQAQRAQRDAQIAQEVRKGLLGGGWN